MKKATKTNWKALYKKERQKVLDEVRAALIEKKRALPKEWERGFMSAVSVVECLK